MNMVWSSSCGLRDMVGHGMRKISLLHDHWQMGVRILCEDNNINSSCPCSVVTAVVKNDFGTFASECAKHPPSKRRPSCQKHSPRVNDEKDSRRVLRKGARAKVQFAAQVGGSCLRSTSNDGWGEVTPPVSYTPHTMNSLATLQYSAPLKPPSQVHMWFR